MNDKKNKLNTFIFNELGKLPPQAIDVEEAVLAEAISNPNSCYVAVEMLFPEVFYKENFNLIFKAIQSLYNNNKNVDLLTLTEQLKKSEELELVGGTYLLSEISSKAVFTTNIQEYCLILLQKYIAREGIKIFSEGTKDLYESVTDIFDLIDKIISDLIKLRGISDITSYKHISSIIQDNIALMKKLKQGDIKYIGLSTSFTKLDKILKGLKEGEVSVVGGRPGMGKTSFMLCIAKNIALNNKPIAFFSLEMPAEQIGFRLQSIEAGISYSDFLSGDVEATQLYLMENQFKKIMELPIYIDDSPSLNIIQFRGKVLELKRKYDVQIIFLDYIQLMRGLGMRNANRETELSLISQNIKAISKELKLHIMVGSQLNREVEKRHPPIPKLSDLRESGSIEQDADVVIFCYRPEYYGLKTMDETSDIDSENMAVITVSKHRNGATGNFYVGFQKSNMRFTNYDENEGEQKYLTPFNNKEGEEDNDIPF